MITVFEKIPEIFIQMYDYSFRVWASEFRVRGPRCAIVFRRPRGTAVLLDAEGRAIAAGAWLTAEVDRSGPAARVVIRPASARDEEMIARHVREMAGEVLH